MQTIGVYIITKNEEENIGACLESVKWAEEIVLVDDFSSDRTIAIAKEYNCQIIQSEWRGYGKQKQFALENLHTDWALNIDADERVTTELATEIRYVTERGKLGVNGYEIPFIFYFLKHRMRYGGCGGEKHLRLFRRNQAKYDQTKVHENMSVDGEIGLLKNPIIHHSYKNMEDYLNKFEIYTSLAADLMYERGKRPNILNFLAFPWEFFRRYILFLGFLDGQAGLIYAWNSSLYVLVKYKKLWLKYHPTKK